MDDSLTVRHITENRQSLLKGLDERLAVVRARTQGVAYHYRTGFYLHGRPGTGKTHTVRETLKQISVEPPVYRHGHITPLGLFELLEEFPESVLVLDDLGDIFRHEVAKQLLLAALEKPTSPDRSRVVSYQRAGVKKTVAFSGGIIAISNKELHGDEVLEAVKSRIEILDYNPTAAQIGALIADAADRGWPLGAAEPVIPADETREIAGHVIGEAIRLGARLDLRLYFVTAIADYVQWGDGLSEVHWKDLVTASIQGRLVKPRHKGEQLRRDERIGAEITVVREILKMHPADRKEQLRVWKERTGGKSPRAFYRRLSEAA